LRNYFASYEQPGECTQEYLTDVLDYRLVSYFTIANTTNESTLLGKFRNRYKSLMLDSGAFSAWTNHITIDPDEFIFYCIDKEIKHKEQCIKRGIQEYELFDYIVALDLIPSRYGDNVESAEKSRENYESMVERFKQEGLSWRKIIPVYHQWEELRYLEDMIKAGIDYIGISPSNDASNKDYDKRVFLMETVDSCMDGDEPKAKFHAFGLSSFSILRDFKTLFYSADAKTWGQWAENRIVLFPKLNMKYIDAPIGLFGFRWIFDDPEPERVDIGSDSKGLSWYLAHEDETTYKINEARIDEICLYYEELGYRLGYSETQRRRIGKLEPHEHILKDTWARERKHGYQRKGDSPFMWTLKYETYEDGTASKGLIHNTQAMMYLNIIAFRWWHSILDPAAYDIDISPEPDYDPEEVHAGRMADPLLDKISDKLNKRLISPDTD